MTIKMWRFFNKTGLILNRKYILEMRSIDFLNYLKTLVGNKQEIKLFAHTDFQYYGQVDVSSFIIKENNKTFGKTSDAKLTGKVIELDNKIEIQIETLLFEQREYLFAGAGFFMFLTGLYKIFTDNKTIEDLSISFFGLFFIIFTYAYIRSDSKRAVINFENVMEKVKLITNKNSA